ncbi:metalloprotease (plasmid) [Achromobacter xylosoxidans]|nr:metalloprotease [Achromobacter xylosoxidans]
MAIRGRLFTPGAAAHRLATLTLQPDGTLLLNDGCTQRSLDVHALRWSSRIGATARRCSLPDGAVFETADNHLVDALERRLGQRTAGLVHRLEHNQAPLVTLIVLVIMCFLIGTRWVVPLIGDTASRFVPPAVEAQIGATMLETLDRLGLKDSVLPAATRQAIQTDFNDLAAHTNFPSRKLELLFRRGGKLIGANALALPGGRIIVTDELVALAPFPTDLAGVLAHEIAHIEYRHSMRRLGRIAGLSSIVLLVTGNAVNITQDIGIVGAGLVDLSYSREFEHEADKHGTALMRLAGKDPETLVSMLERLNLTLRGDSLGWLSSHPPTADRIRLIRQTP